MNIKDIPSFEVISSIKEQKCITFLLLLFDGRLATAFNDSTIKIYSSFTLSLTLQGHSFKVTSLDQLPNSQLVSCSVDKTIKIWTISENSYKCEHTINEAHSLTLLKVISLSNNRIASCSNDKTIKIWSSAPPYHLLSTLDGHATRPFSIYQPKGKEILVSGEYFERMVIIWNLTNYKKESIFKGVGCYSANNIVQIDSERLCIGDDNSIYIINIATNKIEKEIQNKKFDFIFSMMLLTENILLLGINCGDIIYVDLSNDSVVESIKAHRLTVNAMCKLKEKTFCSCSRSGELFIWKY